MTMPPSSAKSSFIIDLKKYEALENERETVRVVGIVTEISVSCSSDNEAAATRRSCVSEADFVDETSSSTTVSSARCATVEERHFSIMIDDGTDLLVCWVPPRIIRSLSPPSLREGNMYDCILKVRERCGEKQWLTESIVHVESHIDEHFRWLEVVHHDQSSQQPLSPGVHYSNFCHKFGFPTRKRNCAEVYRLISINARLQQQQQQQLLQRKKVLPIRSGKTLKKRSRQRWNLSKSTQSDERKRELQCIRTNRNKIRDKIDNGNPKSPCSLKPEPIQLDGLSLEDLALVLQKSEQNVKEMIEELQLEGKIYQSERGEYLPL